mgnify:CR=1 FL=1
MQATRDLLIKFKLFQGLSYEDLEYLCAGSFVKRHARRSVILSAGINQNQICVVFEGRLQGVDFTIDGKEVGLYFVEPGDYCGEMCVFDDGPLTEHVIAIKPAVVVLFSAETMRNIAEKNPKIMLALGNKLASRIRQMSKQRALLSLPNILQRVSTQLWLLIPEPENKTKKSIEISNLPTHMEIAIMLNLSRETITRVFQQLQKRRIVSRSGQNRLTIENFAALKSIVDGAEDF